MRIELNSKLFEYDLRGLLQAFFPWEKFPAGETEDPDGLSVLFFRQHPVADPDPEILVSDRGEMRAEIRFSYQGKCASATVFFDRSEALSKTRVKQALYRILSEATGKTLPWGTLTGIRPTKLVREMLDAGEPRAAIETHFTENLLCSEEKTALALEIANRERTMLSPLQNDGGYCLYVGIPFCPSTCLYCSFSSVTLDPYKGRVDEYLSAVERELAYISKKCKGRPLHAVYFGGGTPTSLSAEALDRLLQFVEDRFPTEGLLEWTVEAGRPDSITREKLRAIKRHPVTRISVNPQTMHQKTLDLIGRRHTVEDVRNAFALAREEGFGNINMDLIFGLPGETETDIRETLSEVLALGPESLTVHALAVKRSSRLNLMKETYQGYRMALPDTLMQEATDRIRNAGLQPYHLYRQKNMAGNLENVGFSKPGLESVYNVLIMEETEDILAAGAGAMTKHVVGTRVTRAANPHNVDVYLKDPEEMIRRKEALFSEENAVSNAES